MESSLLCSELLPGGATWSHVLKHGTALRITDTEAGANVAAYFLNFAAARLIEKGVRVVQICYAKGDPWDHHFDIEMHRKTAMDSDQPFAALIKDLKARVLFEDTIIVAGSEFGRTPVVEMGSGFNGGQTHNGRDHDPHGFTMWLAGGGIKKGFTYGATDDFGWKAIDKPVHVHDIYATILYLLGIDHTKLTYCYSGRDYRLTDVSAT